MKRLSVIIITWNEKDTLDRCLNTIYPHYDFSKDEIVLVDNGSVDGTVEHVQKKFPEIRLLCLPKNIGIAPARNRGIIFSSGKYCMTLDNDTVFEQPLSADAIEEFFETHPNVGVWGYMLYNVDGTYQGNARRFPGWLQPLAARVKPIQKMGWAKRLLDRHLMNDLDPNTVDPVLEIECLLGANQIFSRETAARLNLYDHSKFLFGPDDIEFCYRAMKAGQVNYLVRGPKIIHDYRRRTRKFTMMTVHHIASYYRTMIRHRVNWI